MIMLLGVGHVIKKMRSLRIETERQSQIIQVLKERNPATYEVSIAHDLHDVHAVDQKNVSTVPTSTLAKVSG